MAPEETEEEEKLKLLDTEHKNTFVITNGQMVQQTLQNSHLFKITG